MNTTVRNIGNSKGIILPKSILTQCDIETDVFIEVKEHRIIISASPVPKRKGWEKAFKEMNENEDDELAILDVFIDENMSDWTWK
jgi:antitoxin MazE